MTRSHAPVITVKIPIAWDEMTSSSRQRLEQITGRDSRIIHAFFGIIEENEGELLRGKGKKRIDENKLHAMTMTALRVAHGEEQRLEVEHDFKERFPRISANELSECRRIAIANYESYLALRAKKWRKASRPAETNSEKRIPRMMYIPRRAKLVEHDTTIARLWLDIRDSLDSVQEGRRIHDRLRIPLKIAPFHLEELARGKPKAVQVFADRHGKWWTGIIVRLTTVEKRKDAELPPAILGIDLGINCAACTTLLTQHKVSKTRYFKQKEKHQVFLRYEERIADLQHDLDTRRSNGKNCDGLIRKLKELKTKRADAAKTYDRALVSNLLSYIEKLSQRYQLYVGIGRLKGIRNAARRGNYKGPTFRGMVHRWSFSRITEGLKHGLEQLGWEVEGKDSRFHAVPENWTSIMCWKCGNKGVRPKQSLFVCHTCGFRTNADRNGSLNIARRLLTLIPSLKDETGLGRWATPERGNGSAPKAARRTRSAKQKSSLSKQGTSSAPGESAVVRFVQLDLSGFGDETGRSDNNPAVAKAVENLAAPGRDVPGTGQETEAETARGTVSC
ncbi:MAG: transposase [Candidatus Lokiarchaeota archaeon]|nr:transposase [Candidatus Lokiarchaeota archaeon]